MQTEDGDYYATENDTVVLHISSVFDFTMNNQITQDNLFLIYSKIEVEALKKKIDAIVREKIRSSMHAIFVRKFMI